MASASTLSANVPAKDLNLVHTVQLKPMIKAHFSGRMLSSGISDVVFASVYSEKIHLKKMNTIIIIEKLQEFLVLSGSRNGLPVLSLTQKCECRLEI